MLFVVGSKWNGGMIINKTLSSFLIQSCRGESISIGRQSTVLRTIINSTASTMIESKEIISMPPLLPSRSNQVIGKPEIVKYAGYAAEFSFSPSTDNNANNDNDTATIHLLPVPTKFIPEELVLWGQEPSSMEILVFEKTEERKKEHKTTMMMTTTGRAVDGNGLSESSKSSSSSSSLVLKRRTEIILPGVGCGLDNLHTNRSDEEYYLYVDDTNICKNNDDDNYHRHITKVMTINNNNNNNNNNDDDKNRVVLNWYNDAGSVGIMDTMICNTSDSTATTITTGTKDDDDDCTTASASGHNNNTEETITTKTIRLETLFALPHDHRLRVSFDVNITIRIRSSGNNNDNDNNNNNNNNHSKIHKYHYELLSSSSSAGAGAATAVSSLSLPSSSITMQWERRYDRDGNCFGLGIDQNGHLDTGTVTALIGEKLRTQRKQITTTPTTAATTTTTCTAKNSGDDDNDDNDDNNDKATTTTATLSLPGNITISVGRRNSDDDNSWYVDISLLYPPLSMISTTAATADNGTKSCCGSNSKPKQRQSTTILRTVSRKFYGSTDTVCCNVSIPTYTEKES